MDPLILLFSTPLLREMNNEVCLRSLYFLLSFPLQY